MSDIVSTGGMDPRYEYERQRGAEKGAALSDADIDYTAAIAYCYKTLGHAQGTRGCIAFARGAEWMRDQLAADRRLTAEQGGALADELVKRLSFLRIVTDAETLKQIRVLAAALTTQPQAEPREDRALDLIAETDHAEYAARKALSAQPQAEPRSNGPIHVRYCTIYQTKEGLPVMTDSSESSTWDVRLTFSDRRNAWGDFLEQSPTRIDVAAPTAQPQADPADRGER